jgi:hypothetical protein
MVGEYQDVLDLASGTGHAVNKHLTAELTEQRHQAGEFTLDTLSIL